MPGFGGFAPGAERYGGATPTLQRVLESLNANRGSAYNTTNTSTVWVENMAIARAITDFWEQNQRLSYQNDPFRMTVTLARWEAILGLSPLPTDTPVERRARVQARFARTGQRVFTQYVSDQLKAALGAVFVKLIHLQPGLDAVSWWPNAANALVSTTIAAGSNGATLPVNSISIASDAGIGSPLTSQPPGILFVTNAAGAVQTVTYTGKPLPNQAISANAVYGCSGGTGTLATGGAVVLTAVPWYSTIGMTVVKTQVPPGWTEAQYQAAVGKAYPILDDIMPSWQTWSIYRNGPGHSGGPWAQDANAGFFLDDANNLDGESFDR